MTRSRPPTLLTTVRRTLIEECQLPRGARLLLAVSGGIDSSVMLHALARLAPRLALELRAHGVDHGLRPGAAAELASARQICERCGVPFAVTRLSLHGGANLQARARAARYEALRRAARASGASLIATAHHADDRAETVLLRLLRGAPAGGLAVLPVMQGDLVRPLIRVRRSAVELHAERHAVPFLEDPSNRDRRFARTRVREELLPLLKELSPGIVAHLNALADDLLTREGPLGSVLPRTLTAAGRSLPLRRAHREAIRRAARLGRSQLELLLEGGQRVRVDPGALVAAHASAGAGAGGRAAPPEAASISQALLEEMRAKRRKSD